LTIYIVGTKTITQTHDDLPSRAEFGVEAVHSLSPVETGLGKTGCSLWQDPSFGLKSPGLVVPLAVPWTGTARWGTPAGPRRAHIPGIFRY